ncbi:hypothetical protein [Kitasatospora sp. LaBMicrA B282]|uniref:TolB family protein n=1 Tax=Kitasatospora sp. LaBMicrA B282 TaxID=3420949 RepID=UPI003D118C22
MLGLDRAKLLTAAGACAAAAVLAGAGAAPAGAAAPDAAPPTAVQVCLAPGGAQPDKASYPDQLSADGRYLLFDSPADNLTPQGNNGQGGIYRCDLRTGRIVRVDLTDAGAQPDGISYDGSISADGRYVAFTSYADDLVPGTTKGVSNVYLHDLRTGRTRLVSAGDRSKPEVGDSAQPSISADGRYVAYGSSRADLVPGDTNQVQDVFVFDRCTGTTVRVSVHSDGGQATLSSFRPQISADGSRVIFNSRDWTLGGPTPTPTPTPAAPQDIRLPRFYPYYLHDLRTGATTVASVEPDGTVAAATRGSLSADGRYLVFTSLDNDFRAPSQVLVRDLRTGTTTVAAAGDRDADEIGLTADGHYAYFSSTADNLLPGGATQALSFYRYDLHTATTDRIYQLPAGSATATAGIATSIDATGHTLALGLDPTVLTPTLTPDPGGQLFTVRLPRH